MRQRTAVPCQGMCHLAAVAGRRQRLRVGVAVVVVVADGVVGLDAEVVVEVHVVLALDGRVREVAHVDDEIDL